LAVPLTPISQVILRIDKAFQDELVTDSGIKFYIDPSYKKEWQVSVTATVEAIPEKILPQERKIAANLTVGDEVAISYMVVADLSFAGDQDRFMPYTEGDERMREFVNGKGEWIRVYALPGKIAPHWVGYYMDRYGELVSGAEGNQSDVERWMAQFPYDKTDIYTFNNFFEFSKRELWKCDLSDIFAKKVNGHWEAVGNRVLCTPIDESVPTQAGEIIDLQQYGSMKIRYQDRALVQSGGASKGIKRGDIVSFNPLHLEKYSFGSKDYYLINENLVLGKWSKPKA
jgi:hypothetical protein